MGTGISSLYYSDYLVLLPLSLHFICKVTIFLHVSHSVILFQILFLLWLVKSLYFKITQCSHKLSETMASQIYYLFDGQDHQPTFKS